MRVDVLTIFPGVFPGPLGIGVVGRALESGTLTLQAHDLRDHTDD
ncbi:MAG TPA: tRNA (guanosine(37)-N1)-methyltransferase TrmD, partial [Candidatus Dormibacteraeota bacterium]